jgi:hypothetical protein
MFCDSPALAVDEPVRPAARARAVGNPFDGYVAAEPRPFRPQREHPRVIDDDDAPVLAHRLDGIERGIRELQNEMRAWLDRSP